MRGQVCTHIIVFHNYSANHIIISRRVSQSLFRSNKFGVQIQSIFNIPVCVKEKKSQLTAWMRWEKTEFIKPELYTCPGLCLTALVISWSYPESGWSFLIKFRDLAKPTKYSDITSYYLYEVLIPFDILT